MIRFSESQLSFVLYETLKKKICASAVNLTKYFLTAERFIIIIHMVLYLFIHIKKKR